jgi:hypothetical protein
MDRFVSGLYVGSCARDQAIGAAPEVLLLDPAGLVDASSLMLLG